MNIIKAGTKLDGNQRDLAAYYGTQTTLIACQALSQFPSFNQSNLDPSGLNSNHAINSKVM